MRNLFHKILSHDKHMLHDTIRSVIFVQPTVPRYREGFFECLHNKIGGHLVVYASKIDMGIITERRSILKWERPLGSMISILPGLLWQQGVLDIPIKRNDLVIVSGAPRCLTNLFLLAKAKWRGAKTMWWGHYWSSTSSQWRADIRLKLMRQADSALFYTDREVNEFRCQYSAQSDFPVFALNNGVDNREIKAVRCSYTAEKRGKRVLFIGRLTNKSNLTMLLDALAHKMCADVGLDVIGDGQDLSALRSKADKLGLSERIAWHEGLVDEEKIAAIANHCRIFVYPGAVGLSLIHALCYGLPVIVHNDRWAHMPEIAAFEEGSNSNGVSFEKGSVSSLTNTIASLIADAQRLEAMSRTAIALTDKSFNTDAMVDRFIEALETLEKD